MANARALRRASGRRPPGGLETFGGSFTPLDETLGIITPSALHYVVQRGGTPDIDPRKHRLLIHGLVDRPVILTMEEIRRLPSTSRILFLECQGNSQLEWRPPPTGADLPRRRKSVRGTHGLTSCSEWTGVPLSLLLREAGVQPGATWIVAEGADATGNERSIPLAKAMDDVLVAYGQNGEAMRPENGYPLRLIVPGWDGQHQRQVAAPPHGGRPALPDADGRCGATPPSCRTGKPDSSSSSWRRSR